jgi:hypothetical protein
LHITSVSTGQITVGFCSCVAILTNYYLPIKRALAFYHNQGVFIRLWM